MPIWYNVDFSRVWWLDQTSLFPIFPPSFPFISQFFQPHKIGTPNYLPPTIDTGATNLGNVVRLKEMEYNMFLKTSALVFTTICSRYRCFSMKRGMVFSNLFVSIFKNFENLKKDFVHSKYVCRTVIFIYFVKYLFRSD